MIRLTFVLRRKPDLSREEFQEYWRRQHGPLVAKHSTRLGMLRYVQVHTLDDPINDQMAEARGGMEEPYDGVAELWWWSRERIVEALAEQAAQDAGAELLEDERTFIDLERSPLWFAHEYPQVNPVPEDLVARERSPVVKLFFCLRPPAGNRSRRRSSTGAPRTARSSVRSRTPEGSCATCRCTGSRTSSRARCARRAAR